MSDYIKREDAVKVAAQVLTEVAPVLFPGTIAEEIIEKRMNNLPEAELRSGDRISRCELFNRLATITAEDPNEMKAKIYAVIQEMETEPERVIAEIKVDTEELMERIREEYELEDNIVRCKECRWLRIFEDGEQICRKIGIGYIVADDDFCSYGERAEQTEPETDCSWR